MTKSPIIKFSLKGNNMDNKVWSTFRHTEHREDDKSGSKCPYIKSCVIQVYHFKLIQIQL